MPRSLEMGHTKQCLAASMIAYIQNIRDDEGLSDVGFQLVAQDGIVHPAYDYLADGLMNCICPDLEDFAPEDGEPYN